MDWDDFTRLLTLVGHLSVIVAAGVSWRRVKLPIRRMATALVVIVSSSWALFYLWVVPTYWGDSVVSEASRNLAAAMSRLAGTVTVLCLLGLLWAIRGGEHQDEDDVRVAAERLRRYLGDV